MIRTVGITRCLVIVVAVFGFAYAQPEATAAAVQRTAVQDLANLAFATSYRIQVDFKAPFLTFDQVRDALTIEARNKNTNGLVSVTHRTPLTGAAGFPEEDEEQRYGSVLLFGRIRPDVHYQVTVRYPDGETDLLDLEPIEEAIDGLQWFLGRANLRLEPIVPDTGGIGVQYDFSFVAPPVTEFFVINLTSDGEIGTGGEDSGFQNVFRVNLALDYRIQPQVALDLGTTASGERDIRSFVYPVAIRLSPAGVEANRDLSVIDYTASLQVVVAVPYSDLPILLLHRALGVSRSFYPMTASLGYTYAPDASFAEGDRTAAMQHRLEGELLYDFPITNSIDINSRYRAFYDLESGDFRDLLELAAIYFFDPEFQNGLEFSYVTGSLPPTFMENATLRLGFSFRRF